MNFFINIKKTISGIFHFGNFLRIIMSIIPSLIIDCGAIKKLFPYWLALAIAIKNESTNIFLLLILIL